MASAGLFIDSLTLAPSGVDLRFTTFRRVVEGLPEKWHKIIRLSSWAKRKISIQCAVYRFIDFSPYGRRPSVHYVQTCCWGLARKMTFIMLSSWATRRISRAHWIEILRYAQYDNLMILTLISSAIPVILSNAKDPVCLFNHTTCAWICSRSLQKTQTSLVFARLLAALSLCSLLFTL